MAFFYLEGVDMGSWCVCSRTDEHTHKGQDIMTITKASSNVLKLQCFKIRQSTKFLNLKNVDRLIMRLRNSGMEEKNLQLVIQSLLRGSFSLRESQTKGEGEKKMILWNLWLCAIHFCTNVHTSVKYLCTNTQSKGSTNGNEGEKIKDTDAFFLDLVIGLI